MKLKMYQSNVSSKLYFRQVIENKKQSSLTIFCVVHDENVSRVQIQAFLPEDPPNLNI